MVAERLEELPDVSERDYYLLTTRLEVIEVAVMALRLEMQKDGREGVVYGEADYDAEDDEAPN